MIYRLLSASLLLTLFLAANPGKRWKVIEKGLQVGEFYASTNGQHSDSSITILRINPKYFRFELFSITADSSKPRTVEEWSREYDLLAVVNGGMFQEDHSTSVGYFKSGKHLNNGYFNRNNSLFVSGPKKEDLPQAALLDRTCDNVARITEQYDHILQSIRMVDCDGKNTWKKQPQKWSMVIIGQDKNGNILLIHNRTPYAVHHLVKTLLSLPIHLEKAMYLEGGSEAALYLNNGSTELRRYARPPSTLFEQDGKSMAWPIPNIIGVRRAASR